MLGWAFSLVNLSTMPTTCPCVIISDFQYIYVADCISFVLALNIIFYILFIILLQWQYNLNSNNVSNLLTTNIKHGHTFIIHVFIRSPRLPLNNSLSIPEHQKYLSLITWATFYKTPTSTCNLVIHCSMSHYTQTYRIQEGNS